MAINVAGNNEAYLRIHAKCQIRFPILTKFGFPRNNFMQVSSESRPDACEQTDEHEADRRFCNYANAHRNVMWQSR